MADVSVGTCHGDAVAFCERSAPHAAHHVTLAAPVLGSAPTRRWRLSECEQVTRAAAMVPSERGASGCSMGRTGRSRAVFMVLCAFRCWGCGGGERARPPLGAGVT